MRSVLSRLTTRPGAEADPAKTRPRSTDDVDELNPRSLRVLTVVLAAACGLTVANLYYAQPLLAVLATAFGVSQSTAAIVVTASQLGYAIGLLLLLPLGDLLQTRALTSRLLIGTAIALTVAASAPTFGVFLAFIALVGVTSVVAQILVPFAASLAPPESRGMFVGRVMSGLLIGILLARTLSSLVAAAWGWRSVFYISAALMLILSLALWRMLPARTPHQTARYGELLLSLWSLLRTEGVLRRRAASQATMFGTFTAYWTSIAYELSHRHGLSQTGIGIFALVGAAGALAAPVAGWLGDHGYSTVASGASFVLAIGGMAIAGLGVNNLVLLALGGVLLDFAVQSHQILSQRAIYALRPDARARITSVFIGINFCGGALASALSGRLHASHGWTGVVILGIVAPAVGFAIWSSGLRPGVTQRG